jgi:uncharacterized protein YktA (UPF0223 family)
MPREIVEPTRKEVPAIGGLDTNIEETHPAWGLIGASRVQGDAVMFDSDIRHHHYITIRLARASRRRDLNHDWLHREEEIIEVEMSEAQWASFVSSMNTGNGVPCTITREGRKPVPGMPYAPRLQESMDEVRNSAEKSVAKVAAAYDAVEAAFEAGAGRKELREKIRTLKFAVAHMPANAEFAAKSLSEHAENVVQKARADIEAMVVSKAEQLQLDPADVMGVAQLPEGDGS